MPCENKWEWLERINLIWPVIFGVGAFTINLWSDVKDLKQDALQVSTSITEMNKQLVTSNDKLTDIQANVLQLISNQETRITVLEKQIEWKE